MGRVSAATILIAVTLGAQSRPEFEVASIKAANSGAGRSSTKLTPGAVIIENAPLMKCIALAYGISEDRAGAIAAPDWLESERFDIEVKFPPNTPQDQVRVMFQNLLADRFRLKVHRESREGTVYVLVAAKNGPKLKQSAPGTPGRVGLTAGRLSAQAAPMSALADRLSSAPFQLGRQVMDRTGLTGLYDFTLEWMPDVPGQSEPGPSLFTALQEQLGLKLETQKAPVDVLVVDSVEKTPTGN